ncbi:MAG: ABC-2 type transporter [Bacillota bacterium]|nr:MAG: ABC-2 type transporter [Bacillota bacterium]MBS3949260.1 ABC transporter permease [Peptococcaceae bacterium]
MKLLTIIYYSALRNLKDRRMLLIMLIMPIILIAILGMALDSMFAPRQIEKSSVAYLNADIGPSSNQLTSYLASEQVRTFINVTPVTCFEAGQAALDSGSAEAFIYVPPDFSQNLMRTEGARIHLHTSLQTPLIKGFLSNYVDAQNSALVVTTMGAPLGFTYHDYFDEAAISLEGKAPRAIDYYSIQTLLQVMLMGGWYGISSVKDDGDMNTHVRLHTAPISPWTHLLGKVLANVVVLCLQSSVVVIFSKYVYGANWSGNALLIVSTLLVFSILTISIGFLMGGLFKESNKAFGALWCLMLFFSIIAGALGNTDMGKLARLSPNYYAKTALFGTIYGGSPDAIHSSILVLSLVTLTVFTAALALGRRITA